MANDILGAIALFAALFVVTLALTPARDMESSWGLAAILVSGFAMGLGTAALLIEIYMRRHNG